MSKSSSGTTLERIRARVQEKLQKHKEIEKRRKSRPRELYVLNLATGNCALQQEDKSELDSFLKEKVDPYPGARLLSGWKHLNRFYTLCRKPIVANLQKGWGVCIDPIWRIIYPCSFYVTITRSAEGVNGSHTLILWYSSSFKVNFPIAASTFDGHFNRDAPIPMIERIKYLRLTQTFFQSQESETQKIPL